MNKRLDLTEPPTAVLPDKMEMVTVFRNGNLLTTTLNRITFVFEQGRRTFQHYAISADQKNLLYMVRSLQIELGRALSLSRHVLRPGEQKFELISRDPDAPWFIRLWAHRRAVREPKDSKVVSALHLADEMERWRVKNPQFGMSAATAVESPRTLKQAAEELVRLAQNNGMTLSISVSQTDTGTETKIDIGKCTP